MPPNTRCPLRPCSPAAAAWARNAASSSGFFMLKVTFIQDRASLAIELSYNRDASMAAYKACALVRLRSPAAANPPALFSHLNTRPAMYQANVGGVFNMDDASATAL